MATVYERIRKLTIEQLGIKDDSVTAASSLSDLGADSLDVVELIMAVEKEFTTESKRLSIPDEEMEKFTTVQDIVEFVKKQGFTDYQQNRTTYSNGTNYVQNKTSRFGSAQRTIRNTFRSNSKPTNDSSSTDVTSDDKSTENNTNNTNQRRGYHRYYRHYSNNNKHYGNDSKTN